MTPLVAAILQSAMVERPRSYDDLVNICGLSKPAVARWIKTMHLAGFAYIAGWGADRNNRLFVPLWAWGREQDAPRPGPQRTPAERMKALRAARKEVLK